MSTTFVFGAGASRDAGYPFAKDMGRGLLNWMEKATPEGTFDYSASATSLRETFDDAEDIEALLTRIDEIAALHDSESLGERIQAAQALTDRQALIQGLRRWFEQIGSTPSSSYRLFAREVVKPGDTVITFNYDVSLDKELKEVGLWEAGDGYGFEVEGLPFPSRVNLLKLHGSINWRALLFGGRKAGAIDFHERSLGRRPVFCDSDLRMLGYVDEVDNRLPRGRAMAMVDSLILPVREKQFFYETSLGREWTSFWDSLWGAAASSLRSSNHIVLCGYSVLPIDERACKMLLEDPEITAPFEVCCGDDSDRIVRRLRSFGRNAYPANQLLFGDWVAARKSRRSR